MEREGGSVVFRLGLAVMLWLGMMGMGWGAAVSTNAPVVLPANVEKFVVRTGSAENREVPFYVRKPARYDATAKDRRYRVLFVCPVLNGSGLDVVTGAKGNQNFGALCDERDWFLVSCTFLTDKAAVRDRSRCYYYPERFSGKAVVEGLDQIARRHPIVVDQLLMKGMSGGAQFVHRFAIWAPERVTAVVVNSSSWFDEPGPRCRGTAWLLNIGESDPSYPETVSFIGKLRALGVPVMFRSYIGVPHQETAAARGLAAAFLTTYDERTRSALAQVRSLLAPDRPAVPWESAQMAYVGDSQTWRFTTNVADRVEGISEENRVFLPTRTVAEAWGAPEEE